ncbi:MAG TPA: glycosyltransferase family 39 protein [Anaerolineaceae bacterium]|nr:glycosyltransferase family 39 protein [Anaerolineaceae bacterium]
MSDRKEPYPGAVSVGKNRNRTELLHNLFEKTGLVGYLLCVILGILVVYLVVKNPGSGIYTKIDLLWAVMYGGSLLVVLIASRMRRGIPFFILCVGGILLLIAIPIIRAGIGLAFVGLVLTLLAAVSLGDWIGSRLIPLDQVSILERLILATVVGLGGIMVLGLILGYSRLLYPGVAYGTLAAILVAFYRRLRKEFLPILQRVYLKIRSMDGSQDYRFRSLYLGLCLVLLIGPFLWSIAPSIRYDALTYHLFAPATFVAEHQIVQIPEALTITWAHYAEMLYTFGLLLAGQPLPGLYHLLFGILTAVIVFVLGRRLVNRTTGLFASVIFLSTPIVSFETGTAYIDLFVACFSAAMVYCGVRWWQKEQRGWLIFAGIFAGLSLGVKLTSAPIIVAFSVIFLLLQIYRSRKVADGLMGVFSFAVPIAILLAPWLVRDWIWTGDPIWPFGNLLKSKFLISEGTSGNSPTPGSTDPGFFLKFLQYPWMLVVNSKKYYHEAPGAILGALPLLGFPWLVVTKRIFSKDIRFITVGLFVLVGLGTAIFMFTPVQLARYLSPMYPLLAIIAGVNSEGVRRVILNQKARVVLSVLAISLAAGYLFSTRLALTIKTMDFPQRNPYKYFLGLEDRDEFLRNYLPVYPVFQYLDHDGDGSHLVLSIGNEYRLYTKSLIDEVWGSPLAHEIVTSAKDETELAQKMSDRGYDYILVNEPEMNYRADKYLYPVLSRAFFDHYTQLVFVNNGIYLYRFIKEGVQTTSLSDNLLENSGFETLEGTEPVHWTIDGLVTVEKLPEHIHQGETSVRLQGTIPAEEYGFVYQTVPVIEGKIYTAGYWVQTDQPVTIQLQMHWLDEQQNVIGKYIEWQISQPGWSWYDVSDLAPKGAQYGQLYASINGDAVAWFDDLCFVEGQRCP